MKTCPHCGNTFETDLKFCPQDGAALRVDSAPGTLEGGVVAGRYEIVRELGRGGMGVVYLANHVQMERRCALKVLRGDSLTSPDAVARFHREARSASQISHPNVVSIYDFGEAGDGMTYLAMEYVEGRSLDALLDEVGALSPRRAARIMWQIANGLTVAHDLKIVHRDLKPANIMLTRYRSWEDFVKVVDFGIAKAFGVSTTSKVTSTGLVVGTPGYMSPEQWTGDEIDHRSDIYSLAMICVRMLAGAPPANRPALPIAGALLLEAIPTTADWPAELKTVLGRGLAPFPEERYQTVSEFATEFVTAVTRWIPTTQGVREPWEERLSPASAASAPEAAKGAGGSGPSVPAKPHRGRKLTVALGGFALVGVLTWVALGSGAGQRSGLEVPASDSLRVTKDTSLTQLPAPIKHENASSNPPRGHDLPAQPPASPPPAPSPAPGSVALPLPVSRAAWTDSLAALRAIFDLDHPVADSARRVVDRAENLLRQTLPDSARIEVAYRMAEAQLYLGLEPAACRALQGVQPISVSTGYYARSIRALLSSHCP